ncbi:MAG: helix-turn-helix domain-containing protein [Blastocatellia bacterium]|jgi:transcriptional regulator with XRE-family HTH domain
MSYPTLPAKEKDESLSAFIRRIISEENLSQRQMVERAARMGFRITQSYISQIMSGTATNVTIEKLQALAAGLNRPEEELFDIARGGKTEDRVLLDATISSLLVKFRQLSDQDRSEMTILLKALDREIEDRLQKHSA